MSVDIRSQARVIGRLELLAVDLIGSADFYHRLFDWEFTGDFSADETTLVRGDPDEGLVVVVAGDGLLGEPLGRSEQWEVFFDVASVDETSERAWRHGGDVLLSPHACPDGSRMAIIRDPSGAVFGVVEEVPRGRATDAVACDRGRLVGMELHTSSADAASEFYGEVFNWATSPDPDPTAVLFTRAGRPIAGLVADPSPVLSKPMWIAYFGVADVSEACEAVEWLGGTVLAVTATGHSRPAALVADPGGAVFGLSER
jgi:predicted enzyme related to lactoylglutathione lyase